jgi:predicted RNA-binding protein YlqC (UPF0109 family)
VGSIIGKRGDNIKAIREEVNIHNLKEKKIIEYMIYILEWCSY